jgi:RHS repeat-associated protein
MDVSNILAASHMEVTAHVDTLAPTGYAQVIDELQSGTLTRTYSLGLERISEDQQISSAWTASFYGYDGHGSVRQLTNSAGAITDTYDYDAFGNLIDSTGSTPNNYLFAGEQHDPALSLYYNRARYYNATTGRFWSMDIQRGNDRDPLSLHKYLYSQGDPVDHIDPSGNEIDEIAANAAISMTLDVMSTLVFPKSNGGPAAGLLLSTLIPMSVWNVLNTATPNAVGFGASLAGNGKVAGVQVTGGFGLDYVFSARTGNSAFYLSGGLFEAAGNPAVGVSGWAGVIYNLPSAYDFSGPFFNVAFPASYLPRNLLTILLTGATAGYAAASSATNSGNSALAAALAATGAFSSLIDPSLLTADVFFSPFSSPYVVGFAAMFGDDRSGDSHDSRRNVDQQRTVLGRR